MTLTECRDAAISCLPVVHTGRICGHVDNLHYVRILEVGFRYDANGKEVPFVQLLDRNKNSVTYAVPSDLILESDFLNQQKEKERASA